MVRRLRRAFTLIELLVVIAIIAILAAILFPVFAQAREAARKTSCGSNIRQLGTAFQMYLQDFDETFPLMTYSGAAGTTQPDNFGAFRWPWLVLPYIRNMELFRCPSQSRSFVHPQCANAGCVDPANPFYGYLWGLFPNYGFNWGYLAPDPNTANTAPGTGNASLARGQSLAAVNAPADTVMLADSIWTPSGEPQTVGVGYFLINPPPTWAGSPPLNGFSFGRIWPRHQNRAMTAFVDGHVKSMTIDQLKDVSIWDRD